MSMLEEFYDICLDNDFDDVVVHDNVIYCNIRSLSPRGFRLLFRKKQEKCLSFFSFFSPNLQ